MSYGVIPQLRASLQNAAGDSIVASNLGENCGYRFGQFELIVLEEKAADATKVQAGKEIL
jgi:hypothetical protein